MESPQAYVPRSIGKPANMHDLAVLLARCGNDELDDKGELIAFVDATDKDTGEVTVLKVVF